VYNELWPQLLPRQGLSFCNMHMTPPLDRILLSPSLTFRTRDGAQDSTEWYIEIMQAAYPHWGIVAANQDKARRLMSNHNAGRSGNYHYWYLDLWTPSSSRNATLCNEGLSFVLAQCRQGFIIRSIRRATNGRFQHSALSHWGLTAQSGGSVPVEVVLKRIVPIRWLDNPDHAHSWHSVGIALALRDGSSEGLCRWA
jgi:hypothetical protein